ncbi:hypothetical protein [Nocardia sp. NPDC004604]|uniref:hypothetical protein n=1 Tax=Nocardia sp. NPDC004604 TaxID=3157013 RepID=UPI0033A4166F
MQQPRVVRHATESELARPKKQAGLVLWLLSKPIQRSFDKREAINCGLGAARSANSIRRRETRVR